MTSFGILPVMIVFAIAVPVFMILYNRIGK